MKRTHKSALSAALGTALTASLAHLPAAAADDSPFSAQVLQKGYMVADNSDKAKEGKCGEGKCGGGKCGAKAMKTMKGNDAESKAMKAKERMHNGMNKAMEGKCGGPKAMEGMDKAMEGKCGEGKCGGKK